MKIEFKGSGGRNFIDLESKTFNKLTVLAGIPPEKGYGGYHWWCECVCGNKTKVLSKHLRNGNTKSCGCGHFTKRYKDVTGSRWSSIKSSAIKRGFDFQITVEQMYELYEKQNKKCFLSNIDLTFEPVYNASMDRIDNSIGYHIDNINIVHSDINKMRSDLSLDKFICLCHLVSDKTPDNKEKIDIIRSKHSTTWKGFGLISSTYWGQLKKAARKRKFSFDIDMEYAWNLFVEQDGQCAITKKNISFSDNLRHGGIRNQTASLDRIDSSKYYVEGNLQWIHKDINKIKSFYDQTYFINMCTLVSYFQRSKT